MGPSAIDLVEKPDLVAPGVGIESLADPGSTLFVTKPEARLWGTVPTGDAAVPEPERHEHGRAGGGGHGRADAAGESGAHAGGVKAILRASAEPHAGFDERGAGRRISRCAGGRRNGAHARRVGGDPVLPFDGVVEDDGTWHRRRCAV